VRTFKDSTGTEWLISVNLESAMRLKNEADFNIKDITDNATALVDLTSDPFKQAMVLWVLLSEQASERNLKEMEVMKLITGECLEDAIDAVIAEIISFFPSQKRSVLQHSLLRAKELQAAIANQALKRINEMMDSQMQQIAAGKELDLSSLASQALTPES